MPLWNIYTPVGAYSAEDKKALSAALMNVYVEYSGMPNFYVNVLFHEIAEENFFIGAEPRNNFVRFVAVHIARQTPSAESRRRTMQIFEEKIAPFVKDRGYDWEMHIDEASRDFWTVQGLVAPPPGSEAEKLWARQNRPISYETV